MSFTDAASLQRQLAQREIDIDSLVNFLSYLRHEFKHQAVEPKAIEIYFFCLIKGSFYQNVKVSQYSFACLCHLVKRIYFQDQPKLRRYANDVVPVLIEKLADNSKVHDIARKALTDYWRATSLDVERCLRKAGFLNDSDSVREQTLAFLCSLQTAEPKFSPRTLLFDIVSTLRDPAESVRNACKDCVADLYKNATAQAMTELKSEMQNQNIPSHLVSEVLSTLGIQGISDESETGVVSLATPVPASNVAIPSMKRTPLAVLPVKAQDENIKVPVVPLGMTQAVSPSVELFLKQLPATSTENLKPTFVASSRDLEHLMEDLIPAFDGKETEANWAQRQKNIVALREILRGNAYADHAITFITCLRSLSEGITKAVSSLRTTLSVHGCKLIMDLATITKNGIDPFVDGFLQSLVKLSSSTKKMAAQSANVTITVLLAYTSFQPRVAGMVSSACRDKNAQTRLYAAGWLQLTLIAHQAHKTIMESFNCAELFETCIKSGLADANPNVREALRPTYWEFQSIWPQRAATIMKNLDAMAKKALQKSNPSGESTTQKVEDERPPLRGIDRVGPKS
ncbi:clasp N terminal-domain-containing protein [Lipomyces tetrasporus]|uniref:Protein STU1 n=1 Tax=Lipomyces tetrasporus TaxID=54092 RepID=A0AAD7QTF0_9ASCO|nr:clasp N terminal-domain-containing protein [Lipomyces tetrasporus]KAJ8101179.1 clasp N terminal-domain-containing protein [Lipomyces tetrasporus]